MADSRGENLHGKVYDKIKGAFVNPKDVTDPKNSSFPVDKTFFLKNGSLFSRIDAEIELYSRSNIPLSKL